MKFHILKCRCPDGIRRGFNGPPVVPSAQVDDVLNIGNEARSCELNFGPVYGRNRHRRRRRNQGDPVRCRRASSRRPSGCGEAVVPGRLPIQPLHEDAMEIGVEGCPTGGIPVCPVVVKRNRNRRDCRRAGDACQARPPQKGAPSRRCHAIRVSKKNVRLICYHAGRIVSDHPRRCCRRCLKNIGGRVRRRPRKEQGQDE